MGKALNLQDMFLNQIRKEGISVTVYLLSGVKLEGYVRGFDTFCILFEGMGKPTQLIYKHAISTIVPSKALSGGRGESEGEES